MSTRVETRRSSKRPEPVIAVSENTYGTRSASKTHIQPVPAEPTTTPMVTRKRPREESAHRRSSLGLRTPLVSHEHKRTKPRESGNHNHMNIAVLGQAADDKSASEGIGGVAMNSIQDKDKVEKKKKITPAMERMKVLEERFTRMVKALLKSEAAYTDAKIIEIKRGNCPELIEANDPIECVLEERLNIAEKKLALQKDEADRRWNAARTSAQYDFINGRAELRYSIGQSLSKQIFAVGREYRELSMDCMGVSAATGRMQHPTENSYWGPGAATLTEVDEDFLLMDIPARKDLSMDKEAIALAPILNAMTQSISMHDADRSHSYTTKRAQARPSKSRRLEPAKNVVPAEIPVTEPSVGARDSNLPTITSLLSSEKHPLPVDRRPYAAPTIDLYPINGFRPGTSNFQEQVPDAFRTGARITGASTAMGYSQPLGTNSTLVDLTHSSSSPDVATLLPRDSSRIAPRPTEYAPWPPHQHQHSVQSGYVDSPSTMNGSYVAPRATQYPYEMADYRDRYAGQTHAASDYRPAYGSSGSFQDHVSSYKPYHQSIHETRLQQPQINNHTRRPSLAESVGPGQMLPPLSRPPPVVNGGSLLHPFRRSEGHANPYPTPPVHSHDAHGTSPFSQGSRQGRQENGR